MKRVGQARGLGPGSSEKEPGAGGPLFVSKGQVEGAPRASGELSGRGSAAERVGSGRIWWRSSRGSHTHTEET